MTELTVFKTLGMATGKDVASSKAELVMVLTLLRVLDMTPGGQMQQLAKLNSQRNRYYWPH